MRTLIVFLLAGGTTVWAVEEKPSLDKRIQEAAGAIEEVMHIPDKSIPRDLLNKAKCIVIIPDLKKGAFVFGGKYGRGFASCRHGAGFGPPAAIRIEGGSFGLQLGASSTDVVLLVMNDRGMGRLMTDKFTLGGEAAIAVGPLGRETSATTDAMMTAEILSWSRSRGVFIGLSLEGATLRPDNSENEKLYGKEVHNREILTGLIAPPRSGRPLIAALDRYLHAPEKRHKR